MTLYVNVPLSEKDYQRIKQWAEWHQKEIGEAIADYLTNTLPLPDTLAVPLAEPDATVAREKAAYLRLYPHLKEKYRGKYVAICQGQLVDHDDDYGALFERIDDQYPDTFVWLTKVEEEPIGTITFRSPRFAVEDE